MAERVLSIEIGNKVTRVCETEYKGESKIYASFFFATPEGVVTSSGVEKTGDFRERLLEKLEEHHIRTKRVVFAMTAMGIGSKEETVPKMKEKKRKEYLKTNMVSFFPVNPENYQMVSRSNGPGEEGRERIQMYALAQEVVQSYEELAKFCGLHFVDLEFVENGIAQNLRKSYPGGHIANINVDEQGSVITILADGAIALQRNISYGIHEALEAVQEAEEISYLDAFAQMGDTCCMHSSLSDIQGEDALKDEVTEELRYLVSNVNRILEYYISKNQGVSFDKVLLSGLGSYCQGLRELLESEISDKMEVVAEGMFFETVVAPGQPIGIDLSTAKKASMAKGMESLSAAKKFLVACILICVVMTAIPSVYLGILHTKQNKLEKSISSMAQAKKVNDAFLQTKGQYEELLAMQSMTETPNDAFLALLAEMEGNLPTDAVVQELTADQQSVTIYFMAPSKKVAAKTLEVFRSFESVGQVTTDQLEMVEDTQTKESYRFVLTCYYPQSLVPETEEDVEEAP